jgi:AraC family transcriptional regulator
MMTSGVEFDFNLEQKVETQTIRLSRTILTEVAAEFLTTDPDQIQLHGGFYRPPEVQVSLFQAIGAALRQDDAQSAILSEYLARALAAQLLVTWAHEHGRLLALRRRGRSRTVTRSIEFIQSNLGTRLTLEKVAAAAGVGVTTLCREFRLELGAPPHQVITELRVAHAKQLLGNPLTSLSEVAVQCGFSSQQHMTKTFRDQLGVTPGAYRKLA